MNACFFFADQQADTARKSLGGQELATIDGSSADYISLVLEKLQTWDRSQQEESLKV